MSKFEILNMTYCIEQNFGGEKTLVNLAKRHNSPSILPTLPMKHMVMQFVS